MRLCLVVAVPRPTPPAFAHTHTHQGEINIKTSPATSASMLDVVLKPGQRQRNERGGPAQA